MPTKPVTHFDDGKGRPACGARGRLPPLLTRDSAKVDCRMCRGWVSMTVAAASGKKTEPR